MADMAPTLEMRFKAYVRQQSTTRILWNDAKKKAAAKKVDTAKSFKLNLGKELDKLLQLGLAAQDVSKHYGPKDPKSTKAKQSVTKQAQAVRGIVTKYVEICKKSEVWEFTPADQKKVWKELSDELSMVKDKVSAFERTSTADKVTTKSV